MILPIIVYIRLLTQHFKHIAYLRLKYIGFDSVSSNMGFKRLTSLGGFAGRAYSHYQLVPNFTH